MSPSKRHDPRLPCCPRCGGSLVACQRQDPDGGEPTIWLNCENIAKCKFSTPEAPALHAMLPALTATTFEAAAAENLSLRCRLTAAVQEAAEWRVLFFDLQSLVVQSCEIDCKTLEEISRELKCKKGKQG